jgi:sugar lactone lactonase YvrE
LLTGEIEANDFNKKAIYGEGRILVKGAALHGANGLMFDADDRLHIACVLGSEIVVMDPRNGKILKKIGIDKGVFFPDDLAFGPDGSLYWTDIVTGDVCRLSPDGITTKQFVAPGANPITFSDDGRLFVALDFFGDALYEIDPDLVDPPRLIAVNLGWLNGMDWGPDGYLYGPIWTQGRIVRIDVDSDPLVIETVVDGLGVPAAVKFDSKGFLHVVDNLTGEIIRIDITNEEMKVLATAPPGLDNLAFDSRDRLYVSHADNGSILQVLAGGRIRTVSKGGIILPAGVAVMSNNNRRESVLVADFWNLKEYDVRSGRLKSVISGNWLSPGSLSTPQTVSTDGERLIISSTNANVVQVYDPENGLVIEEDYGFSVPMNAIPFQGDIVVAELLTGSVVRMSDHFVLATGLIVPVGLAATENDLWVSDWATGIVWQIVQDNQPSNFVVADGLSNPEGLAVNKDGNLLVVETGADRLSRINIETGEVIVLATGLELDFEPPPGVPPNNHFNGVAVGSKGYIYVTGAGSNVLYRFKEISAHHDAD